MRERHAQGVVVLALLAYHRRMGGAFERKRDRVVERLQSGYAAGDLSTQTLERRIEYALLAESPPELSQLTTDLDPPTLFDKLRARLTSSWSSPAPSGLLLALVDDRPKTVGRASSCDLVLADNSVSRRHAMLVRDGDRYFLTDLGSTNGTYLNGRCIRQAEVVPGDHLQLGELHLTL